jgi:hypothetical protein
VQAQQFAAFASYFESRNVFSVSDGLIAMRRRGDSRRPNWVEFEDLPPRKTQPCGDAVWQFFQAQDALADLTDERLLEHRLRMAPGLVLESAREWTGEEWKSTAFTLRQNLGLRLFAAADTNVANLARLCDGSSTLRDLLARMAAELGVEFDSVASGCLAIVRQMMSRGFLLPERR